MESLDRLITGYNIHIVHLRVYRYLLTAHAHVKTLIAVNYACALINVHMCMPLHMHNAVFTYQL